MENVYDIIEEFYNQDEGWNYILRREYAEGFLRRQAWNGKSQEELFGVWDQLMMLCLYVGGTDLMIGDMTKDDFIDCVAWCGRNVSEFIPNYAYTEYFLNTCVDFFAYLNKNRIIGKNNAPQAAKEVLLRDGKLRIIKEDGSFESGYVPRSGHAAPDPETKIFLNVGDKMDEIYTKLHEYFHNPVFGVDLERAAVLYYGSFGKDELYLGRDTQEMHNSFWDYFLYDYRMMRNDMHPLKYFYRDVCFPDGRNYDADFAARNGDILKEFSVARLVCFTVEREADERMYHCRDFLTDEHYLLNLPIDASVDIADMIFVGHLFYNGNMLTDNLRGYQVKKYHKLLLKDILQRAYGWIAVQKENPSWQWFLSRYPMVVRNLIFLYAAGVTYKPFSTYTEHTEYEPIPECATDEIEALMRTVLLSKYFSLRDFVLLRNMWRALKSKDGFNAEDYSAEEWIMGLLYNFIKLNQAYTFNDREIEDLGGMTIERITAVAERVEDLLDIEEHDPRFSNEEGLLIMMMNAHN